MLYPFESNRCGICVVRVIYGDALVCKSCQEKVKKAKQKSLYRKHTERFLASAHKRRTLLSNSPSHYTAEEWKELIRKNKYTCRICGLKEPKIKLTVDHIIPVTKGGTNDISNIQPLCKSCNSRKGNKLV